MSAQTLTKSDGPAYLFLKRLVLTERNRQRMLTHFFREITYIQNLILSRTLL